MAGDWEGDGHELSRVGKLNVVPAKLNAEDLFHGLQDRGHDETEGSRNH